MLIYQQAYHYAYWYKDLPQRILEKRSPTFRVGYMIGKSDRDYQDCLDELERFNQQQRWRKMCD
jgi:hypothetical protein